jgi:hypothetical protein
MLRAAFSRGKNVEPGPVIMQTLKAFTRITQHYVSVSLVDTVAKFNKLKTEEADQVTYMDIIQRNVQVLRDYKIGVLDPP